MSENNTNNNISFIHPQALFTNPEKIKSFNFLKNILDEQIPRVQSLSKLHKLINELNFHVNVLYENIQCKSGCSRCCKFYGSPDTYIFEWKIIKEHLDKNFDEKSKKRINKKLKEHILGLKEQLELPQNTDSNLFISNTFNFSECPFLYKNMCSIYEVRPVICRMFGSFQLIDNNKTNFEKIITCAEELERWKEEGNNDNNLVIFLPITNAISNKIKKMMNPEEVQTFPMKYWLTEYFDEY